MKYNEFIESMKSQRKLQLIETAARLWKEKEFSEVKMTDIAKACDIGVASVYRYFGTKSGLAVMTAVYLWEKEESRFTAFFQEKQFDTLTGKQQIREILHVFLNVVKENPGFLQFIRKFDQFILTEQISEEELQLYNQSVTDSFEIFHRAFTKGKEDGTINVTVDEHLFYRTATHSLMSLSQKLLAGNVLKSDLEESAAKEVELLITIFMNYL